jgi:hypothetical protein
MELLIKTDSVEDANLYKDGDIVQAFSYDRIHLANAQVICNVNNFPLDDVTGLRTNDSLLMKYLERASLYRFERTGTDTVKKINLSTLGEEILGAESIDVSEFLKNRLKSPRHKVFGSSGSEIWYGDSRELDINAIWDDIEAHSDSLKSENSSWPFTEIEKRHLLILNSSGFKNNIVTELSSGTASSRQLPVVIEEELIAKRQWQVPYWDLVQDLGINVDDVRNKDITLDVRKPVSERPYIDNLNVDKVVAGIITL